ncbi:hypothetical protein PFDG_05516 [Plasmodium falciparum Dd2]|uniref:Rab-GAP TBC domain-containing protein n=1 Tax=Plasmodium falciparum (isolate Dd2) TaxID=57267 RepID=A0A0L7M2T2_PLAF4|nr:hypothetical protein PFDG_05516 [Plasmodium falciparum Dd2]
MSELTPLALEYLDKNVKKKKKEKDEKKKNLYKIFMIENIVFKKEGSDNTDVHEQNILENDKMKNMKKMKKMTVIYINKIFGEKKKDDPGNNKNVKKGKKSKTKNDISSVNHNTSGKKDEDDIIIDSNTKENNNGHNNDNIKNVNNNNDNNKNVNNNNDNNKNDNIDYNNNDNIDYNNNDNCYSYDKYNNLHNDCNNQHSGNNPDNDNNNNNNMMSVDLENETKFLEDWEVTQKKIYDPTIGLRKHYTNELLSCGEKNNVRILEKWSSMVNRDIVWFHKAHRTTYLRRVKRGIPQKYRWKIWFHITNAKNLYNKFQKKYYYLSKKKSNYTNLILIDISRTFPELLIFDKYAQQQLYRVLNAYSNYEPSVGYCQGMNFLVGLLLIISNFNELETFCVLVSLMNNYYLKDFYKEKFPLLNRFIYLFERIMQNEIPDLVDHFNNEEVYPPVYLHQWLLTLFIASLPIKSVIVIWDYLFSTSIKKIIIISVALLKILKSYLMKHKFEKILKLLKSLKYNESNDDILIAKLLIKKSESIILINIKFIIDNITTCHFNHIQENITQMNNTNCINNYDTENDTTNNQDNNNNNNGNNNSNNNNNNNSYNYNKYKRYSHLINEDSNFVILDGVPLLNFFLIIS